MSRMIDSSIARTGFLFVLALLASCGGEKDAQKSAAVPAQEVEVVTVLRKNVPSVMEFVGQTKGSIDAEIRARVEGVVTGIHFEEGKEVKEGQLLYTIDPAPFQAKVAEYQGKLAAAETQFVRATSDVKRLRPLAEMKAVSAATLDAAVAQEGASKASVDAAKAALESATIELGYTKILSPTSGIIGQSKAKVGEFVGRAPNPVILDTVSNLEEIHAQIPVNEKDYLRIARDKRQAMDAGKEEEKATLELILSDGSVHPDKGQIAFADREVDPKTGTLMVEVKFPNPGQLLRPGQFAKVRATFPGKADALLVPKRAVRELQGETSVFVVKADNTVEQRRVTLGAAFEDLQIVQSGVSENERVVAEGIQRMKPGMLVNPRAAG